LEEYNNKGSGLGLSICNNLAKSLNHGIRFKSKFGQGSKFYLLIKCEFVRDNQEVKRNTSPSKKKKANAIQKVREHKNFSTNILNLYNVSNSELSNHLKKFRTILVQQPDDMIIDTGIDTTIVKDFDLFKVSSLENIAKRTSMTNNLFVFQQESFNFCISCGKDINNLLRIAVIDDHKLVRDNTVNLIKSILDGIHISNYEIIEGSDGIDLLNIVQKDKEGIIKCIFIDENMEYLNGSEAVRIIRKLEDKQKIKKYQIVSITAFDDIDTTNTILSSGINAIITKPCTKSSITNELKKLVLE
jgi:CheY-like chemotaxis protein